MSNTEYGRVLFAFMLAYTIMKGLLRRAHRPAGDAPGLRAVHGVVVGGRPAAFPGHGRL